MASTPVSSARVVVGTCARCRQPLRAKARAVVPVMHLNCKCGESSTVSVAADVLNLPEVAAARAAHAARGSTPASTTTSRPGSLSGTGFLKIGLPRTGSARRWWLFRLWWLERLRHVSGLVRAAETDAYLAPGALHRTLERLRGPRRLRGTIAALRSLNSEVHWDAENLLKTLHDDGKVEALIPLLADPARHVHSTVAFLLGEFGDPRAVDALLSALDSADIAQCQVLLVALSKIPDVRSIPKATTFLEHPEPDVRSRAAYLVERVRAVAQPAPPPPPSNAPLSDAVRSGDAERVSTLLAERSNFAAGMVDTGLGEVVFVNDAGAKVEVARRLLDAGARVDYQPEPYRATLLLHAVRRGNLQLVRLLISRGADPFLEDRNEHSPMRIALEKGDAEIIETLRAARPAIVDSASFLRAARSGSAALVQQALDAGMDIGVQDEGGFPALVMAAYGGHTDIVRLLLSRGASPDTESRGGGETALSAAVCSGNPEVVSVLVAAGADVNRRRAFDGGTPLAVAEWLLKTDCADVLRRAGAHT